MDSQVKQAFYERRKRLFNEIEHNSEDEVLNDELYNPETKRKKGKSKKITSTSQFQTLKEMRMMKRFNNKENITLSQDQLDFAKKVIEQKIPENLNKNNLSDLVLSNEGNFSLIGKTSELGNEILNFLATLCSCEYKIIKNDSDIFSLQVILDKNEKEKMKFILDFYKIYNIEYVDYTPQITSFKLKGEDQIFLEELEIHKEDLGKMMKRLLVYKFD
jgi:hypothetical protein